MCAKFEPAMTKQVHGTKYHNRWKCHISGDIGIKKSKPHSNHYEGKYSDKHVLISKMQM